MIETEDEKRSAAETNRHLADMLAASQRTKLRDDMRRYFVSRQERSSMENIYKLVAEGSSGAPIHMLAAECYQLSRQLGVPVDFIHNGKRYKVELKYEEVLNREVLS